MQSCRCSRNGHGVGFTHACSKQVPKLMPPMHITTTKGMWGGGLAHLHWIRCHVLHMSTATNCRHLLPPPKCGVLLPGIGTRAFCTPINLRLLLFYIFNLPLSMFVQIFFFLNVACIELLFHLQKYALAKSHKIICIVCIGNNLSKIDAFHALTRA